MKVIVAGNKHYGLGKSIYEGFPEAEFCSRSCGDFNFYASEPVERFGAMSLDYDVCIFCSAISHFRQVVLANYTWEQWNEHDHKGHIIVIGSTADHSPKRWLYPVEKRALHDWSRLYAKSATGGGPDLYPGNGIKITYIGPGMLDCPKQNEKYGPHLAKLDPIYVVDTIKWVLSQPDNVNIHEISMDPIQK